ncbi:hypothetical protein GCM10020000_46230 [Streptomyces olivoverticillatus]
MASMSDYLFSGVLVRFPRLKLAYSEGQMGWIPYLLERADDVWREHRAWGGVRDLVPEPPSTYYYRQVFCCFFSVTNTVSHHSMRWAGTTPPSKPTTPHVDSTFPPHQGDRPGARAGPGRRDGSQTHAGQRHPHARPGPRRPPAGEPSMDLTYSPEEEDFRRCLRAWLRRTLPKLPPKPPPSDWPARRAYDCAWQRALYDAGYASLHWPVDAGGQGATPHPAPDLP